MPVNDVTVAGVPSFLEELYCGRLRWDLLVPFPVQEERDKRVGDSLVSRIHDYLVSHVNPTAIDERKTIPPALIEHLRSAGYFKLQSGPEVGGAALSDLNAFRFVEAICSWSVPVGLVVAIENSIGMAPLSRIVTHSPLRELLAERVSAGLISSFADTEPAGAANHKRDTSATMLDDGESYLITGEKVFIGNAPLAELIGIIATVSEDGKEIRRLFIADRGTPGVDCSAVHEFMGIKGFPNGAVSVTDAVIPRDRMYTEPPSDFDSRITALAGALPILGRMYLIAAPSLAISKLCLAWSREFVSKRQVDGVPLGRYEEIQRLIGESLADAFAIESVAQWALLCGQRGLNPRFEQHAAKNITSVLCWRIADRTMSLLAAEGFETASSKARRGAVPLPLERFFRDARGLRISGGVDFQLDNWMSNIVIFSYYLAGVALPSVTHAADKVASECLLPVLSARNREHFRYVESGVAEHRRLCSELAGRYSDSSELFAQERLMICIARIANELFVMAIVLANSAAPGAAGASAKSDLADTYCSNARRRIESLRAEIPDPAEVAYSRLSSDWLSWRGRPDTLADIMTVVPPA
jgi:alkylation response protein AidB-like acyl-CoA dehydrogenase